MNRLLLAFCTLLACSVFIGESAADDAADIASITEKILDAYNSGDVDGIFENMIAEPKAFGVSGRPLLTLDNEDTKAAFAAGWWFGVGYFSAGLYWVSYALLTFPDRFGWMVPFAVFGLAGLLALFPAGAALGSRWAELRNAGGILVFAAVWTAFEWLRGWVLTGFPWNLAGSVWMFSEGMIQGAAVAGVHGLGLLTVIVAAMPAWSFRYQP